MTKIATHPKSNKISDTYFDALGPFVDGVAYVAKKDFKSKKWDLKYGFIKKTNDDEYEVLIDYQFPKALSFNNQGLAVVQVSPTVIQTATCVREKIEEWGKWAVIDTLGNFVVEPFSDHASYFWLSAFSRRGVDIEITQDKEVKITLTGILKSPEAEAGDYLTISKSMTNNNEVNLNANL
jgi:hypothetical protein